MKKYAAEAIGTFSLVFAGTGAIAIDELTGGTVTHVGIGLTFGLVVMAMIYALGDISGAHINPAVTLGFWVARRFEGRQVVPYVASQTLGALAASACLWAILHEPTTLGATAPTGPPLQSFVLEAILTTILMFVILSVSTGAKEKGIMAGAAIGGVVALEALFAGPISGASMNPARSLAPAIVNWNLTHVWVYLAAPCLGAAAAVVGCRLVQPEGCCRACATE